MTDMAALAARYPSVAMKLKAAHLTPRQHEAYRIALFSAIALTGAALEMPQSLQEAQELAQMAAAVPEGQKMKTDSALIRNLATKRDWLQQWQKQFSPDVEAASTMLVQARNTSWVEAEPELLDSLAATGIWRNP